MTAAKSGTFYLHGAMDYWYEDSNNNQNKDYYSENKGNTSKTDGKANFKLEIGADAASLSEVPLPENKDTKFGDLFPRTVASNEGNHNSSIIGDAPVGAAQFAAGSNIVKFTRVDSYNLAIHDILFVFAAAQA